MTPTKKPTMVKRLKTSKFLYPVPNHRRASLKPFFCSAEGNDYDYEENDYEEDADGEHSQPQRFILAYDMENGDAAMIH